VPKSLDRNAFHADAAAVQKLSDAEATLAESTVQAAVAALRYAPRAPLRWLVTGGGLHNAHFMRRFHEELRVPVEPVEAVGCNGDFLEA
jgi:anhydro-N-acetylmuramic acid kinase